MDGTRLSHNQAKRCSQPQRRVYNTATAAAIISGPILLCSESSQCSVDDDQSVASIITQTGAQPSQKLGVFIGGPQSPSLRVSDGWLTILMAG